MDKWDGNERRNGKSLDHDLLTKIDANLTNFLKNFDNHVIDDDVRFKAFNVLLVENNKKWEFLNNRYWMVVGALVLIEVISKFWK